MASLCAPFSTRFEVQNLARDAKSLHAHARHGVEGVGRAAVPPAAAGWTAIFQVLPTCCACCRSSPATDLATGPALLQRAFCRTRGVLRNLSRNRQQREPAQVRAAARHASRAG
eukprot:scaffold285_cov330-Pavlova_lutheri.AAC.117